MSNRDETLSRAVAEANEVFGRMAQMVEEKVKEGATKNRSRKSRKG